jgi:CRISPR/Cas system CSM-associated protein Csm3 (group 7 of RAMP superfamily)
MSDATTIDKLSEIRTTETVSGNATTLSQIHTGADAQTGNKQLLRKEKIRLPSKDKFDDVPFIAGNSVRGHLRRLLAEDLVQRLDYTVTDERLFHLLRAGGVLEKDGKAEIDVGLRREIRDAFPIIDLLGGSTGNQMFGGTVDIHHMTLVCEENNWRTEAQSDTSWREFVDEMHQTRMHDEPDDTGMDVDFGFDFDADAEDAAGSQQMIYHFDTIVPGAQFEHSVRFESYATELARACLLHGLRLWQDEGVIGGMSSSGLGRIDIGYETDLSDADRYTTYVAEQGGAIIEALDEIADK